jgi:hypothetical protein
MPLARRDRFKLRSQLSDVLGTEWSFDKTNLLLIEFGLPTMADDSWHGPSIVDVMAGISDADLIEMYALVMGVETDEVEGAIESTDESGTWKTGYARIFPSHSAAHKDRSSADGGRFWVHVNANVLVTGLRGGLGAENA